MATGPGHLLPGAGLISHSAAAGESCVLSRPVEGLSQMYKGGGNALTSRQTDRAAVGYQHRLWGRETGRSPVTHVLMLVRQGSNQLARKAFEFPAISVSI